MAKLRKTSSKTSNPNSTPRVPRTYQKDKPKWLFKNMKPLQIRRITLVPGMSALGTGVVPKLGDSVKENGALTNQLNAKALHSWHPNKKKIAIPRPKNIEN